MSEELNPKLEESLREILKEDQVASSLQNTAKVLYSYYKALVNAGFEPAQAMVLVAGFQSTQLLKGNGGKGQA